MVCSALGSVVKAVVEDRGFCSSCFKLGEGSALLLLGKD